MSHQVARKRVAPFLTCKICNGLFKDATTIIECLHTFCRKCIYENLSDKQMGSCPVCNIDLGPSPLEKLRADDNLNNLTAQLFPSKDTNVKAPEPEVAAPAPVPSTVKGNECSLSTLVVPPQTVLDASSSGVARRNCPIWFSLVAMDEQEAGGPPLPQISKKFMSVKDGNMPVSFIYTLLKSKLDLRSEDEVDVKCLGESVLPSLSLSDLLEAWIETSGTKNINTAVGSSAEDYVMELRYGRKLNM